MTVKSCEKLEKSRVALTIEASAEEFEAAVNKAYLKMRGKINVPGFRVGKAPRKINHHRCRPQRGEHHPRRVRPPRSRGCGKCRGKGCPRDRRGTAVSGGRRHENNLRTKHYGYSGAALH